MPVIPTRNLPPDAEPWGRSVDTRLGDMERAVNKIGQDTQNTLSGINGTLTKLGEQVAEIAAAASAANAAAVQAATAAAAATAAVNDLAARISTTASIASFNTGTLPNDSLDHLYGPTIPITIDVPTGKLIVTVGCGQATVNAGSGAAIAEATFTIPGYVNYYDVSARMYNADSVYLAGSSLVVSQAFTVAPGTYTITGSMSAWAAGTGASVNFRQPYMTVQVTG